MSKKEKLTIAALVAVIANLVILVGVINNAGISASKDNCFTTQGGIEVCR